jgi:DNA topoisomerase-3
MILSQTVAAEQMQKLLAEGKTDLLDGFVSARTRRKFKAYLIKTPEGKIGFEFEQRKPKAETTKATKVTKAANATTATRAPKATKASKATKAGA